MAKKTFLIEAVITDGGYEHTSRGLIQANNKEEAIAKAEPLKNDYFGWEDREDEVDVELMKDCNEIFLKEEEVLLKLGVVSWID